MESSLAWSFAIVIVATSLVWAGAIYMFMHLCSRGQSLHRAELECQHTNHRRLLEAFIIGDDVDSRRSLALSMEATAQEELKAEIEKARPDPMRSPFTGNRMQHAQ